MTKNRTLALIKPDAVKDGHCGDILQRITNGGFTLKALKMVHLTKERAKEFYAVHEGKPFYENLTDYMSRSPILAMVLEKSNAVEDFRKLIGATDPAKAEEGTIRALYAKSIEANAVHGSDSDENAEKESAFFFSSLEIF